MHYYKTEVVSHNKGRRFWQSLFFACVFLFSYCPHVMAQDLFVRAIVSKRQAVTQEALVLTFKSYSHGDVSWLQSQMDGLHDFYIEELPLPPQSVTKTETLNGQDYKTMVWGEYLLFPLSAGRLTIPAQTFRGMMMVKDTSADPFEAYISGGAASYEEVAVTVASPAVEIDVKPLPPPPDDFSGGVGRLKMSSWFDSCRVVTGQETVLRVAVEGCGNLNMLQSPVVHFPKVFTPSDVKRRDSTRVTRRGVEGRVVYDFGISPRYAGNFGIAGAQFVYYDTDSSRYVRLVSDSFNISVLKGDGPSMSGDIHDIRTTSSESGQQMSSFLFSIRHWLLLASFLLLTLAAYYCIRYQKARRADVAGRRQRQAKKESDKRLVRAHQLMDEGCESLFYEEVLHALWGFAADRLRISPGELSRERIADALRTHSVDESVISMVIDVINHCELSHYAPGSAADNMLSCYLEARQAIEAIEVGSI